MHHDSTDGPAGLRHDQRRARRPLGAAPLTRPRGAPRVLAGVAAAIAAFVGVDVRLVRAVWIVSLVPSLGITGFGYLMLWLLLPLDGGAGSVARGDAHGDAHGATRPAPRSSPGGLG